MITIKDFYISTNNKDNFGVWIKVSKEIQKKYEKKFKIKDEGMNAIWAEYHNDDNSYFYGFLPSNTDDIFNVTEDFKYLNDLLYKFYLDNAI